MSIWTDMIKFDVLDKVLSIGTDFSQTISISMENTTEYKQIATFIPKLNGEVKITIDFESLSSGTTKNVRSIQIQDSLGNVIASESADGTLDMSFEFAVNAFNSYKIFFKNSASSGYAIYVPSSIKCSYSVTKSNGYVTLKSDL